MEPPALARLWIDAETDDETFIPNYHFVFYMDMGPDAPSDDEAVHTECRSCGRNVPTEVEECPACGSGVAEYRLE